MVEMVNALTGGPMWVHESRVDEYLAAGHKLAAGDAPSKTARTAPKKTTAKRKK